MMDDAELSRLSDADISRMTTPEIAALLRRLAEHIQKREERKDENEQ